MEIKQAYDLSHGQKRFWFQVQLNPNGSAFNQPIAVNFKQKIEVPLLHSALNKIVERHFSLRTIFDAINGEPKQFVLEHLEIPIPVISVACENYSIKWSKVQSLMKAAIEEPFDIKEGPLLRACIYKLAEEEYVLFFCIHHIVIDGWSTEIFLKELFIIYQSLLDGTNPQVSELTIQFVDFANWQNRFLNSEKIKKQELYWSKKLKGKLPKLDLPLDYERLENRHNSKRNVEYINIHSEDVIKLKSISNKHGATMFMTLTAALNILLSKITNQQDILIGTPIAGRNHKQVKEIIGLFVNTIVLRNTIDMRKTFSEFLTEVKAGCIEAYANQDYQFDQLVQLCNVERETNRGAIFDVLINYASKHSKENSFSDLYFEKLRFESNAELNEFDLTFIVENVLDEIVIGIHYSLDLFKKNTIKRIGENYYQIIHSIALNFEQRIKDICHLSKKEIEVINNVNDTVKDYMTDTTIPELFTAQVMKNPEAVAIIHGTDEVTYMELEEKAEIIKKVLLSNGSSSNQSISIMMNRSPALLASLMGILKAGSAYVPIDPNYPSERIAYILQDNKSEILIVEERYYKTIKDKLPQCTKLIILFNSDVSFEDAIHVHKKAEENEVKKEILSIENSFNEEQTLNINAHPDDLAYIIYTSGSTGEPKGVMITHRAILNTIFWLQDAYPLSESDVVAQKTSASFTDSVWEFFWTLTVGAKMVIIPSSIVKQPRKLYQCLEEEKVTITQFVPALMNMFINEVKKMDKAEYLPHLKWVFNGGEALPANLAREWYTIFKKPKIANIYGMTESAVYATNYCIAEKPADTESKISLGVPIANTKAYILDNSGQIAGFKTKGEICIGGNGLTKGYWGKSDLTEQAFIKHPITGQKLYRTGDLGYQNQDGSLEYIGRRDYQVQVRGYRVELGEVEYQLRTHEDIIETAVIPYVQNGQTALRAFYKSKKELTVKEMRNYLKEKIPKYMIPSQFVPLSQMPLNTNGKINRNMLLEQEFNTADVDDIYAPPTNDIEQKIYDVWCKLLNIENVGINDSFLDIGGNSWSIIRMIVELEKLFSIELDLEEFYDKPTIANLAKIISNINSN